MGVLKSNEIVAPEFIDRIATLAEVVGHIGLKLASSSSPNSLRRSMEEVVWPFVRRAGMATVVCTKKEVEAHPLLQEILSPDGPRFRLCIDEACTRRFEDFWTGKLFSSDRTIVLPLTLPQIEGEALVAQSADPFVMQNLASFIGRRGRQAILRLIEESPDGVVCGIVGPPDEIYIFGLPEVVRRLVPSVFRRCNFTARYQNYTRGKFVPIQDVLKHLRPKSA